MQSTCKVTQAGSRNYCCRAKVINIRISVCMRARAWVRECVCMCVCVCGGGCPGAWACSFACALVALLIQNATHMRLSHSTTFSDIIS
jgi:hypothetical protein